MTAAGSAIRDCSLGEISRVAAGLAFGGVGTPFTGAGGAASTLAAAFASGFSTGLTSFLGLGATTGVAAALVFPPAAAAGVSVCDGAGAAEG